MQDLVFKRNNLFLSYSHLYRRRLYSPSFSPFLSHHAAFQYAALRWANWFATALKVLTRTKFFDFASCLHRCCCPAPTLFHLRVVVMLQVHTLGRELQYCIRCAFLETKWATHTEYTQTLHACLRRCLSDLLPPRNFTKRRAHTTGHEQILCAMIHTLTNTYLHAPPSYVFVPDDRSQAKIGTDHAGERFPRYVSTEGDYKFRGVFNERRAAPQSG